ncbi:MAG: hypothetical protein ACP5PB_00440 [Acidimicrobiales bacterium]
MGTTVLAGSLDALVGVLDDGRARSALGDLAGARVVVVTTAAAFTGSARAACDVARALAPTGANIEELAVDDRAHAAQAVLARRVDEADAVVAVDGSALHARSVWRDSVVGVALSRAARLVAVGETATVLGSLMIDPRGGAPAPGLGYRSGLVVGAPASAAQLARTRALLAPDLTFAVLGPRGVLAALDDRWRVLCADDVTVTRGSDVVDLVAGAISSR